MAYIRKRGKNWYAEVSMRGIDAHATWPTKGEAKAWSDEVERKIRAGKGYAIANRTLEDALMRYAAEVTVHKPSRAWEENRLIWLAGQSIAKLKLETISPKEIAAWRDERRRVVSGGTVIRDFNLLSHVFTIARREWRWIEANPCSDVARPKDNPARKRRVSPAELALLYAAAGSDPETVSGRVVLMFEFCIETAMRGGEACSMRLESKVGHTVFLPETKNGSSRNVPLSPRAEAILDLVGGNFGLTPERKDGLFRKIRGSATLDDINFHDSRHEGITRLARRFEVLDLARIVGHKNLSQLLTYYHADAHALAAKLRQGANPATPGYPPAET